jgi:hypothetical protein
MKWCAGLSRKLMVAVASREIGAGESTFTVIQRLIGCCDALDAVQEVTGVTTVWLHQVQGGASVVVQSSVTCPSDYCRVFVLQRMKKLLHNIMTTILPSMSGRGFQGEILGTGNELAFTEPCERAVCTRSNGYIIPHTTPRHINVELSKVVRRCTLLSNKSWDALSVR